MNKLMLSTFCALALSACSSASKQDYCNNTNWHDIGKKTGLKGESADVVMKDQRSCAEVGIEIPLTQYKEGWEVGIKEYCSEQNAFALGKKGENHKAENCPIVERPKFLASYDEGVKVKGVNKKIEKVEKQIDKADAEKAKLQKEVAKKKQKIDELETQQSSLKDKKQEMTESN